MPVQMGSESIPGRRQHDQRAPCSGENWGRASGPICMRHWVYEKTNGRGVWNVGWKKTGEILKAFNAGRKS